MPEKQYKSKFKSSEGKRVFEEWYHRIAHDSACEYELHDIDTSYGATRVAVTGKPDGIPVIFLHGWSGNGMLWDMNNLMNTVTDKFKIHLVDVIGQPNNSSPYTPTVRGGGYGIWLEQVMDALHLDSANFVGMSMGGFLIVKLANVAPQRISKAVLMGPAGFSQIRLDPKLAISFGRPFLRPSTENVTSFLKYTIVGRGSNLSTSDFEKLRDMFAISFRHFRPGAQLPYVFSDSEIKALQMPVMMLCGKEDALFDSAKSANRAKMLLSDLKHVELIPELGHALANYELVTERIAEFFA